jgi:hypothetical protein
MMMTASKQPPVDVQLFLSKQLLEGAIEIGSGVKSSILLQQKIVDEWDYLTVGLNDLIIHWHLFG